MVKKQLLTQRPVEYPAEYSAADVAAIQAVALGRATPEQQQRTLNWIIWNAAQNYEVGYRTDPHDHAFMAGRRFVGVQIVKMTKLNLVKITGNDNGENT